MHRRTAAVAVLLGLFGVSSGACSSDSKPRVPNGGEIGVTTTTIRVAVLTARHDIVLHDVFARAASTIDAWARELNAAGGIAGRRIVIDHVDVNLRGNSAAKALDQACRNDFAFVGSATAALYDPTNLDRCEDGAGARTGMPNFATLTAGPDQRGSRVTFPAVPAERDPNIRPKQLFRAHTALYSYIKSTFGVTHGLFIGDGDSQETREANVPRFYAAQHPLGLTPDGGEFEVSAFNDANTYGPFVRTITHFHSQFAETAASYQTMIYLREAAAEAKVDSVRAWLCTDACYHPALAASSAADGTLLSLPYLPFLDTAEATAVPALQQYIDAVGAKHTSTAGMEAWLSAKLLERALSDLATRHESVTRRHLLAAARQVHDFDGGGLIGPTDVGRGRPSPCTVLVQVHIHHFVRVAPKKVGTFDCEPSNLTTFTHNLWAPWSTKL